MTKKCLDIRSLNPIEFIYASNRRKKCFDIHFPNIEPITEIFKNIDYIEQNTLYHAVSIIKVTTQILKQKYNKIFVYTKI